MSLFAWKLQCHRKRNKSGVLTFGETESRILRAAANAFETGTVEERGAFEEGCSLSLYIQAEEMILRGRTGGEKHSGVHEAQNSILQAGKDSSCMTTVLLEARTMMFRSCCLSWVCWYQSLVTSVSWVGIRVT